MASNNIIYGMFTQKGHVSEVKPSVEEEPRMMRQMSFRPEGLNHDTTVLIECDMASSLVFEVRMWIDVRKQGELYFATNFGYELDAIND